MLRILVADDHELVRKGVCAVLRSRPESAVIAEARNGRDAVEKAIEFKPDLIILDISMPVLTGLDATKRIRVELGTSIPVLILSMHKGEHVEKAVTGAGAQGYVCKDEAQERLLDAVDTLMRGNEYFAISAEPSPSTEN